MNIQLDYIKSVLGFLKDYGVNEIELTDGDTKLVVKRKKEQVIVGPPSPVIQNSDSTQVHQFSLEKADLEELEVKEEKPVAEKGIAVVAPIAGTFYRSSSPDSPPFVDVGKKINKGDVLCILESMKLMNEIESDVSGVVTKICIEDAETVDSGTVLMYIE